MNTFGCAGAALRHQPLARRLLLLWLLAGTVTQTPAAQPDYPPFQDLVDAAEAGAVLTPAPGVYAGPVVIDKPLTVDGTGRVTIDGGGQGTVILLKTSGATLKGLHLTNSGNSHNDIDSAVQVRGNFNVIKDNAIDNCLFGIDLQQSEDNIVRRNRISSKPVDLGMRGDAIRLWYSFRNKVTDNVIRDSRDTVVWYSRDNLIAGNDARGGRYSLHFMYSQANHVEDNHYEGNSVGIFLMYSDGVTIRNNLIANAAGTTGIGIGFKETSDVTIENNRVLYCAVGLYLDVSPYQPGTTNRIRDNLIAYNGVAVRFLNDWQGNVFVGNKFQGNITQVVVEGGKTASRNRWEGNFWDDYEGFDRNGDGVGDAPYALYDYADRLWMDVPGAQFFKGSPMLEVIDFLERLAPLSAPSLLVRDERPLWGAEVKIAVADTEAALAGGTSDDEVTGDEGQAPQPAQGSGGFDALGALRGALDRE
jgi:nitrous oxidase accessory protein